MVALLSINEYRDTSRGCPPSTFLRTWLPLALLSPVSPREAARAVLHTLVAATDTTRFALFNVWALLALSRRVQDKLHEEQQQVRGRACVLWALGLPIG